MEPIIDVIDPIEAEVDAIRRKIWEKTKDMTPVELEEYYRKSMETVRKEFHIKTVYPPVKRRVHTPEDDAW